MHHNKYFGVYLTKYEEGKGVPLSTKILAIAMLWISISYTIITFLDLLIIKILLVIITAIISYHILKKPTYVKENQ